MPPQKGGPSVTHHRITSGYAVIIAAIVVHCASISAQTTMPATAPAAPLDLNELSSTLAHGDSAARLAAMQHIMNTPPAQMPQGWEALLPDVVRCADDPSWRTRSEVAVLLGIRWIQLAQQPAAAAIAVEEKLARDGNEQVRHDAVAAGLKSIKNKS